MHPNDAKKVEFGYDEGLNIFDAILALSQALIDFAKSKHCNILNVHDRTGRRTNKAEFGVNAVYSRVHHKFFGVPVRNEICFILEIDSADLPLEEFFFEYRCDHGYIFMANVRSINDINNTTSAELVINDRLI